MVVEVTAVSREPEESRRAEVELRDAAGNSLQLVDYYGAELSTTWKPGHSYRIFRCRVSKGEDGLQLTPSKRTEIEALGRLRATTDLLVIGDTHIGRDTHPKTEEEIDPLGALILAIEEGIDRGVDVVVHVGDIFHESATPLDAEFVRRWVLVPLREAEIPFHFIRGNHSSKAGLELLNDSIGGGVVPLDLTGTEVHPEVALYGFDHCPEGDIRWSELSFSDAMDESVSLLFLHQTLEQLSGPNSKSVDVGQFERYSPGQFQYILSGHHHDATNDRWSGTPVMYTGASEKMSTNKDATDRVAWFLHVENGSISRERYDIPKTTDILPY